MTDKEAIKYLKQLYPNGGHCWLDEQRIEAIGMAIQALQEEPVSEDLKEVANNAVIALVPSFGQKNSDGSYVSTCRDSFKREELLELFKAGANWQKQQMMAKAVDITIAIPYKNGYGGYTQLVDSKDALPFGENLKVLVIKE